MKYSDAVPTVKLFGIPVSKWGMQDTVKYLTAAAESDKPHQVITANPIMVMAALESPAYMEIMKHAELIVPDGTGVVWAAAKAGNPVAERVAGYDLLHELMKVGEQRAWRFYLLGSSPEVIQATAERLGQMYPGATLVGWRDGYFGPDQDLEVVKTIKDLQPHVLFVARGADTQEPWISKYKDKLGVPIMMGVGGSFDVIAGKAKRAPVIMQNLKLEWFYRLAKEPWRYKRMLALPKFVIEVMRRG